jgi:hypothetical protein
MREERGDTVQFRGSFDRQQTMQHHPTEVSFVLSKRLLDIPTLSRVPTRIGASVPSSTDRHSVQNIFSQACLRFQARGIQMEFQVIGSKQGVYKWNSKSASYRAPFVRSTNTEPTGVLEY